MQIITKQTSELKPYANNPRYNDLAVEAVANSIQQFGFKVPILISSDNTIICGHTRHKAANRLKIKEIPCIIADDLTDEQIKAYRLVDNKVGEIAQWNNELLISELEEIETIEMELFDFIDAETEEINDEQIKDSAKPQHFISVDGNKYYVTDEEVSRMVNIINDYIDVNGVAIGVFGVICDAYENSN